MPLLPLICSRRSNVVKSQHLCSCPHLLGTAGRILSTPLGSIISEASVFLAVTECSYRAEDNRPRSTTGGHGTIHVTAFAHSFLLRAGLSECSGSNSFDYCGRCHTSAGTKSYQAESTLGPLQFVEAGNH